MFLAVLASPQKASAVNIYMGQARYACKELAVSRNIYTMCHVCIYIYALTVDIVHYVVYSIFYIYMSMIYSILMKR